MTLSVSTRKTARFSLLTALRANRRLLGGSVLEYLTLTAALFLITEVIMKFTLFIPGAVFTTTVGDATSGFLYVVSVAQGWDPTLGHTLMTNYPFGDDVAKPAYVTWVTILVPLWLFSRVMQPTTALALVTALGYVTSGLGMYGLVKRLTGHWYVAAFAAYAAAFMPYHVYKSSDHLTNVFNVVVILVIGFFVAVWRRATKARIAGLAISVALACYTDGYYIMIAGLTIVGLIIAAVFSDKLIGRVSWRQIGKRFLNVVIAGALAVLLLLPIAGVFVIQNRQVQSDLAQSRGAILQDAMTYAAHPIDFVLPASQNPIVTHIPALKARSDVRNQHSNAPERTNYLGWTVIILALIGYGGLVVARRRGREPVAARDTAERVALLALPLVIVWAFGPQLTIGQLVIPMPYQWLIQVTALWRVPARMVLGVQPLAVLAAAAVLDRLLSGPWLTQASWAKRLGRRARVLPVILSLALTAVLALEYWTPTTSRPFSGKDLPETYTWIKQQSDIKAILELPIGGHMSTAGYYAYAQTIHGLPMIDSSLATQETGMFDALVGAQNMDAINLARRRGVDTVVVHGHACLQYSWGRLVHVETNALTPIDDRGDVCVYRLNPATTTTDDMFPSVTGALWPLISWHLDGESGVWLAVPQVMVSVVDSAGNPYATGQRATLRTDIRTVGEAARTIQWTATQDNKIVGSGQVYSNDFEVQADIVTGSPVTLSFNGANGPVGSNELETMGFEIDARN
jgi:hypothetical protein